MSSLNTLINASGFQHISHQKLMEKDLVVLPWEVVNGV